MGDIVKAERDTKALQAALLAVLTANGLPLTTGLWDLDSALRSEVILKAHTDRKDFE
jgi:hypothetical protein